MRIHWQALLLVAAIAFARSTSAEDHEHDHDPAPHPGDHADEVKLTPDAVERSGIKVAQAKRQTLADSFVVPARLDFNREEMAHVGAAVRGRVVEIKAKVGDRIKKGSDLLVIESPELGEAQTDYLQKRTAVRVAETSVQPLKVAYERGKALYDQNEAVALAEVQKRDADYKVAVGAVETAKAAAAAAENRLHLLGMDHPAIETLARTAEVQPRYAIRAPIAGQVIEREVTLGELVAPEKDALLVLANTDALWVLADVPEARLADVHLGADARVTLAARPNAPLMGKVAQIAPSLDSTTRSARVRIDVPNPDGALRPGMFAKAEITSASGGAAAAVVVPDEAVLTVEGKPAVFVPVAGEPNTFAKRQVEIGPVVGDIVPVLAGLEEAEAYVVRGAFLLKAELGKSEAAHEH